jgi:hypothetical protein
LKYGVFVFELSANFTLKMFFKTDGFIFGEPDRPLLLSDGQFHGEVCRCDILSIP